MIPPSSLRASRSPAYTSAVSPQSTEQPDVSDYAVQPGARVVWCLRRRAADVRCVVFPEDTPIEVRVIHDRDVVVTEMFQEEWMALDWARVYGERLRAQGWHDVPEAAARGGLTSTEHDRGGRPERHRHS
jgi:hypothetical protein